VRVRKNPSATARACARDADASLRLLANPRHVATHELKSP
jgi:hypothetical protein